MSRPLKLLLVALLLGLALLGGGAIWFATRGGAKVAQTVATKLEAALGGSCRVGGARVLSPSHIELDQLACTLDEGPVLGFAATALDVQLAGPALRSLPPLTAVTVRGLHLRLRGLEPSAATGDDDSADDDDSAEADLSSWVSSLALRATTLRESLMERPGGPLVQAALARLADGATIRIERATVELENPPPDLPLPEALSAALLRDAERLEVTVVSQLSTGGTLRGSAAADADGLASAQLRFESVNLLPILQRTRAADVRSGALSGELGFSAETGAIPLSLSLESLVLVHSFLGEAPATLPEIGVSGDLEVADDGLVLRAGGWSIDDVRGGLGARLGPLHGDPSLQVQARGERVELGKLLAALPESLLPDDWAKEIQGTMDARADFGGPLHDRAAWALDWDADFSRMILADGELAAQVRRLRGPFQHRIPGLEGAPDRSRVIGPSDPHFVPLSGVSTWLRAAVISTEDAGFFSHSGFEVNEIKEAMLENLRDGEGRGGSTITQQLAKNLFLSGERTLSRKLKEAVIAWRLESDLDKERILEIYLNIAEWGPGLFGIHDAADHYFARTPAVLKPEEAAFLASLLPAPRRYHGYYHGRGRGLTRNRQERVQQILATMARLGSLDPRQYHLARDVEVELAPCGL